MGNARVGGQHVDVLLSFDICDSKELISIHISKQKYISWLTLRLLLFPRRRGGDDSYGPKKGKSVRGSIASWKNLVYLCAACLCSRAMRSAEESLADDEEAMMR